MASTMASSVAFCSPVLASAAGRRWRRRAAPCRAMRSHEAAPDLHVTRRVASKKPRSQSSTATAGAAARRSAIGQFRPRRRAGSGHHPAASAVSKRPASAMRARVTPMACRATWSPTGEPGRAAAPREAAGRARPAPCRGGPARGRGRAQRQHQPVKEAPTARRAFLEQPVHRRRQPDRGDAGRDLGLAARALAVEAEDAPVRRPLGRRAGADIMRPVQGQQPARDRPAPVDARRAPRQLGHARPAQAAPRRQQRHRLQQVGLAAAIRPEQREDARRRPPGKRGVIAELGQGYAQEAEHGVVPPVRPPPPARSRRGRGRRKAPSPCGGVWERVLRTRLKPASASARRARSHPRHRRPPWVPRHRRSGTPPAR